MVPLPAPPARSAHRNHRMVRRIVWNARPVHISRTRDNRFVHCVRPDHSPIALEKHSAYNVHSDNIAINQEKRFVSIVRLAVMQRRPVVPNAHFVLRAQRLLPMAVSVCRNVLIAHLVAINHWRAHRHACPVNLVPPLRSLPPPFVNHATQAHLLIAVQRFNATNVLLVLLKAPMVQPHVNHVSPAPL